MAPHKVYFTPKALQELTSIHDWGQEVWGKAKANAWLKEIGKRIKTLSNMPERSPFAPENDDEPETIRQLIANRYRVIFTVDKNAVVILHIRGAYVSEQAIAGDDDE